VFFFITRASFKKNLFVGPSWNNIVTWLYETKETTTNSRSSHTQMSQSQRNTSQLSNGYRSATWHAHDGSVGSKHQFMNTTNRVRFLTTSCVVPLLRRGTKNTTSKFSVSVLFLSVLTDLAFR